MSDIPLAFAFNSQRLTSHQTGEVCASCDVMCHVVIHFCTQGSACSRHAAEGSASPSPPADGQTTLRGEMTAAHAGRNELPFSSKSISHSPGACQAARVSPPSHYHGKRHSPGACAIKPRASCPTSIYLGFLPQRLQYQLPNQTVLPHPVAVATNTVLVISQRG